MLNIKDLRPFMFNNTNVKKILNKKPDFKEREIKINKLAVKKKESAIEENKYFITNMNCDSLIWYYNILLNGIQSYHFLGNNAYQEENKMKMELIYKIRENKQILKNHKIKYREVESNLCNDPKININTFLALLIISEINFYYSDDKFYYEKLINPNLERYCYLSKRNDKFYLWMDELKPDIELLKNKLILIENLKKPLPSISNFKKPELEDWCKKLKIKYEFVGQKKLTKSKLYALIQENI